MVRDVTDEQRSSRPILNTTLPGRGQWIAQIVAALVAAAVVSFLKGYPPIPAPGEYHAGRALGAELIGTFALAYVVLNVATAKGTEAIPFMVCQLALPYWPKRSR
jgi:glycerol uptake facilitator-like aquaporin